MFLARVDLCAAAAALTLIGLVELSCASAAPRYGVKVGQAQSAAAGEHILEQKGLEGYGQVTRPSETTSTYVATAGAFKTKAQAWAYGRAKKLEDVATSNPVVISVGSSDKETSFPVTRPFNTGASASWRKIETAKDHLTSLGLVSSRQGFYETSKALPSLTKSELHDLGYEGRSTSGIPALEKLIELDRGKPEESAHKLRLARRVMKSRKENSLELLGEVESESTGSARAVAKLYKAYWHNDNSSRTVALQAFKDVAADQSLPVGIRRDAMRTAAGIAHNMKDYPQAWLAFEQVAETAGDPGTRAEAQVNLAGLAFELARSGNKASLSDVTLICDEVLSSDSPNSHKATAALMKAEVAFDQGDTTSSLDAINNLLSSYPDVRREWISAHIWKGRILYRLDRKDEAKAVFEHVMNEEIGAGERFGNRQPKADAARWLVLLEKSAGNTAAAQRYLDILISDYEGSPETQEARAIMGEQVEPAKRGR